MNPDLAHSITNDWKTFQLLDLAKFPEIAGLSDTPGHGPFMVLQQGATPGDLQFRKLDFVLTRENRWLALHAFLKLPKEERRALCLFPALSEAMAQIGELSGPVVLHGDPAAVEELPAEDPQLQGFHAAKTSARSVQD